MLKYSGNLEASVKSLAVARRIETFLASANLFPQPRFMHSAFNKTLLLLDFEFITGLSLLVMQGSPVGEKVSGRR